MNWALREWCDIPDALFDFIGGYLAITLDLDANRTIWTKEEDQVFHVLFDHVPRPNGDLSKKEWAQVEQGNKEAEAREEREERERNTTVYRTRYGAHIVNRRPVSRQVSHRFLTGKQLEEGYEFSDVFKEIPEGAYDHLKNGPLIIKDGSSKGGELWGKFKRAFLSRR